MIDQKVGYMDYCPTLVQWTVVHHKDCCLALAIQEFNATNPSRPDYFDISLWRLKGFYEEGFKFKG